MCTVVVRLAPATAVPVTIAANRDEMLDRPWDPPGPWWPDHPHIIGGRDRLAGGTWMAVNAAGVVAAVLNRTGSLGPAPGKRSRGELPLIALAHQTAAEAAAAIAGLDAGAWRSFNLVLADPTGAVFVRGAGTGRPAAIPLPTGIHMVTAHDPDAPDSPRVARHLPRLRAAAAPVPEDWSDWRAILADDSGPPGSEINVPPRGGFGTASAAMVFLQPGAPRFLFAPGPPHRADFRPMPWPNT
jgi:hypothetical protein